MTKLGASPSSDRAPADLEHPPRFAQIEIGGGRNLSAEKDRKMSFMDEQQLYRMVVAGKIAESRVEHIASGTAKRFVEPKYSSTEVQDMIHFRNSEPTGPGNRTNKYLSHACMITGPAQGAGGKVGMPLDDEEVQHYIKVLTEVKLREITKLKEKRAAEIALDKTKKKKPLTSSEISDFTKDLVDNLVFGKANMGRNEVARPFCFLSEDKRMDAFNIFLTARDENNPKPPRNGKYYQKEECVIILNCMLGLKELAENWRLKCARLCGATE